MNKLRHPKDKADRLRIKSKKDNDYKIDRVGHVNRRLAQEALEQKEAIDELRIEVLEKEPLH